MSGNAASQCCSPISVSRVTDIVGSLISIDRRRRNRRIYISLWDGQGGGKKIGRKRRIKTRSLLVNRELLALDLISFIHIRLSASSVLSKRGDLSVLGESLDNFRF